ncbi:MAG: site-2 protease family protein [Nitrososphaerales archaeon]|uniref:Peptidase M50 n=1 Tax=uncultured marine thaumarchaeote KM3_10_C07 TaxID=1455986 RepID=A0A075GCJ3_9ARCH|nr:peptidase M50 [uncultured marine thaumarchaeote KM3_10_C07]
MEDKDSNFDLRFPLVIIKTSRGQSLLEKLSKFRFISVLSWISLFLMPIFSLLAISILLLTASLYLSFPEVREIARETGPQGALLIPGINPYLPIIYGWIAIFIGLVIHELSHGVIARAVDVPVRSSGVMLFLFLPIGAFVEVDDTKLDSTSFTKSGRIIAAGAGSNIVVGLISLLLLVGVVNTMEPVADGIPVSQIVVDSPANIAGLLPGDIVTHLNNIPVTDSDSFSQNFDSLSPGDSIVLTIQRQSVTSDYEIVLSGRPDNPEEAFIGIMRPSVDIDESLSRYQNGLSLSPNILVYFSFPSSDSYSVPFSSSMQNFYTSSLGNQYTVLTNLLFWVWFINFNLGIFNALPLGPLDGGQAFKRGLKSITKNKISPHRIDYVSRLVSFSILFLILSMFLLPYLP